MLGINAVNCSNTEPWSPMDTHKEEMGYVTYGSYEKDERVRNKVSFQIAKPKNPRDQSQSEKKMFVFKYI